MRSPRNVWSLLRVVVPIVVLWHVHVVALAKVSTIFAVKSVRRVLHMSGNKYLASASGHNYAYTTIGRFCHNLKFVMFLNILASNLCMSAMRHIEHVVESAEQRNLWL